jgi:MarR family transcriptional regulator, negative regulator of the multidrug operon emrRAB
MRGEDEREVGQHGAAAEPVGELVAVCRRRQAGQRERHELARSEPAALVTLAHYPGQSAGALARTLGLTHSGAVRLADRLVAAGWARRVSAGPGRTLALYLTESGRLGAWRVIAKRQAFAERLVSALESDQAAALEQLAARLLAVLVTDRASACRLCRLCDEPLHGAAVDGCGGSAGLCRLHQGEEPRMSHVRVGIYTPISGTAQEVADLAREGMLDVFRAQPGFRAYGLAQAQEGKFVSVSIWDSGEQARQANELAASWVAENLAGKVRLEDTQVGDFLFYESA